VLDEPTSDVDFMADQVIQGLIEEEFKGCARIVVAHRMASLRDVGFVVVLDQGRVMEIRTPPEVLS
jgi:ATP-binding cassette subfamily C (CFTR/MRP) protein 1